MILTADVGNSNICLAVLEDDSPKSLFFERLSTNREKTAAEYASDIRMVLLLHGIAADLLTGSALSSVVPAVTPVLSEAMEEVTGVGTFIVDPEKKFRFQFNIDDPKSVGADILCDMTGAVTHFDTPLITFDMGTATVMTLITDGPVFQGVYICPGVKTSLRSLTSGSSVLPSIGLEDPGPVIGNKNDAAIKSGIIYGSAGLVDGLIDEIERDTGLTFTVVATGGLSRFVIPYCRHKIIYEPELLIKGLWQLYRDNK